MNANTPERRKIVCADCNQPLAVYEAGNRAEVMFSDVRLIAAAPRMLALLEHVPHVVHEMVERVAGCPGCEARAIQREVEGDK
jgi:hypothetical protein